jgi:hypothetical protein
VQFPMTLSDDERSVVNYLGSHESVQLLTDDIVSARQCGLSLDATQDALLSLLAKDAIKWTPVDGSTPGHWDLTEDGRVLVL